MYRTNKQREKRQSFKESDSAHEGKSAVPRNKSSKVTCAMSGKNGKAVANFQDADSFLGAKNDNKLAGGSKSAPAKGSRSPQGPGSAKGDRGPASPKRPKASGSGMKRSTTSYGKNT